MEIIILRLSQLGIKTEFVTDFNTTTSCFRTQISFSKNDGAWRPKPIFHKTHAAPEHELKEALQKFEAKIHKLSNITIGSFKHPTEGMKYAFPPEMKVKDCPKCRAYCFSIKDNICLSCAHEPGENEFQGGTLRGGYTTNGWVPGGDLYTPESHPDRHNL
jgi:hypothetical protein